MNFTNITAILLSGASITFGAFFGVLRSKIFASKVRTVLHISFYILSILLFIVSIIAVLVYWDDFFPKKNPIEWYSFTIVILALIASVSLFYVTNKFLTIKDTYLTVELNPIVKEFSAKADKNEIKLFGGDLNFFGEHPSEIDKNEQYTDLRSSAFTRTLILCETPTKVIQEIRYGKILDEIPGVELRFYNPEEADLRVRGRIIKINNVSKLLIYTKVSAGKYQAIETDIANSNGALYNSIWNLIWTLAIPPSEEDIKKYKMTFKGK
jgi:hypothetical protein